MSLRVCIKVCELRVNFVMYLLNPWGRGVLKVKEAGRSHVDAFMISIYLFTILIITIIIFCTTSPCMNKLINSK